MESIVLFGSIVSTMMGSTETTLYTIAIYTSALKIKKIRFVLIAALLADLVRNDSICRILSNDVDVFFLTLFPVWVMINIVIYYSIFFYQYLNFIFIGVHLKDSQNYIEIT